MALPLCVVEKALSAKLSAGAVRLIEGRNFGFLATLSQRGRLQVTPVWVDTDGKHLLVNTAIGRVKQRNVTRDPRVAMSVLDHGNPYHYCMVQGRVVEQRTGREADDHIDKLAKKYTGADKFNKPPGERRVILKIETDKVIVH